MEEPRYSRLLDDLVAAAQAPAVLPQAAGLAAEAAPPLVAKAWRKLKKAVKRAGATPTDESLHRIRVRAKRARYAAEAAEPVVGKPARASPRRRPIPRTSSASSTTRLSPRHGCGTTLARRGAPRRWPRTSSSLPNGPPRRSPVNSGGRHGRGWPARRAPDGSERSL